MRLRQHNVFATEIDGATVLLDGDTSTYFSVNAAGTVLLPLLREGASLDELSTRLMTEFELAESEARADVDAFVRGLAERSLLERE